jgi:hypothetical protein
MLRPVVWAEMAVVLFGCWMGYGPARACLRTVICTVQCSVQCSYVATMKIIQCLCTVQCRVQYWASALEEVCPKRYHGEHGSIECV